VDKSVNIDDTMTITSTAKVSTRHYLSSQHLWTALHSAKQCVELERHLTGKVSTDVEHGSYAMTSVMSSVAFLEAFVNEVYSDCADSSHDSPRVKGLDPSARALMSEFWSATNEGFTPILTKYNIALMFARQKPFDKGSDPYQGVEILVNLRNALMHFKPAWHDNDTPDKLEKKLKARIQQSGLLPGNNGSPWVPIKALGASCAEWAPRTARALTDDWVTRLGVARTYEADLEAWRSRPHEAAS
jgi:hypothetical protein